MDVYRDINTGWSRSQTLSQNQKQYDFPPTLYRKAILSSKFFLRNKTDREAQGVKFDRDP